MGNKTVYLRSNGGETVAYEDQITAGLFHIPPKATEVKPPIFTDQQTCQFIDDKWVVADIPVPEVEPEPEPYIETYADKRRVAYDSIGDQLDMIYKDNLNGTTTHKTSVESVKAKFPKPE
jgi:hypothetical protein